MHFALFGKEEVIMAIKNYNHNYAFKNVKYTPNMKVVLEDSIAKKNEFGQDIAFRYRKGKEIIDVSFEQFYLDTKQLGSAYTEMGFGKGNKIAMIGPNSYEWITVFVSVLNSEAVFVPVDKELPIEEIAYVINDSDTDIFFYHGANYDEKIKANLDLFKNVKYFVNVDAKEDEGNFLSYSKLMEKGKALFEGGYDKYVNMTPEEKELKMIVYTSGTTGTAKGVMLSLENVMSAQNYGLQVSSTAKTMINVLPLHHTFGGLVDILVGIKCGTTMGINDSIRNILPNFKAYKPEAAMLVPLFVEKFYQRIWAGVEEKGLTKTFNAMIKVSNALLKVGIDVRRKLFKSVHEQFGGNLRLIVCGGAPMREELGRFFESIGVTITNGYGITECSPLVSVNRTHYYNFDSVGVVCPKLEIRIDNPNEENEGEILVKGPAVMMGYYKNPEKTKEVLSEDGWFSTGDYGKYDREADRLYITGRKKNLIVLKNGKNVYPEEIEDYLTGKSEIDEVIVSAIRDENGEEVALQAEIYPLQEKVEGLDEKASYDLIKAVVDDYNAAMPADYKRIKKVVLRTEPFEKTTSQKIKRKYS